MKLSTWAKNRKVSAKQICDLCAVFLGPKESISTSAMQRYLNGERMPGKVNMTAIFHATEGQVTANDFYGLPLDPPAKGKKPSKSDA